MSIKDRLKTKNINKGVTGDLYPQKAYPKYIERKLVS